MSVSHHLFGAEIVDVVSVLTRIGVGVWVLKQVGNP